MKHSPRGSEWRKWDLHFHTPSSFDYDDKGVTNDVIVDGLVAAGTQVVAVTDHHVIDVERIKELQRLGGDELHVLPGIEMRTELGGSNSVHLIGIFSEECDISRIWEVLRVKFKVPELLEQLGTEGMFVDFEEFAKEVHELGGLVSVHAGSKTNGIEEISNHTQYKQALKTGLAQRSVDIYEVGKVADAVGYKERVFPKIGKILPTVIGSDNHNIRSYFAPRTWIKADPCFLGLRQVIHDPMNRVSLDDLPEGFRQVQENPSRYIKSVSFEKIQGAALSEKWFEGVEVPLNPGLVTVIGNKGSGKSALAESLGLLGNCPHVASYSFLHKTKFLNGRRPKAAAFDVSVTWSDGQVLTRNLADLTPCGPVLVQHLPQNYLESVCNEVETDEHSAFRDELEAVVFSHVDSAATHGKDSLRDVVAHRKSQVEASLMKRREALSALDARIADIERKLRPEHRATLQANLDRIGTEMKAHEAAKPVEVKEDAADESDELNRKVEELRAKARDIDQALKQKSAEKQSHTNSKVSASKLMQAVRNLEREFRDFQTTWELEKGNLELDLSDVVALRIALAPLEKIISEAETGISQIELEQDEDREGSLAFQKQAITAGMKAFQEQLTLPAKQRQAYLESLKSWEDRRQQLIGEVGVAGSLKNSEALIRELDRLPDSLKVMHLERESVQMEIFAGLQQWADVYRELYKPVQDFIAKHEVSDIEFDVSIAESGLKTKFFSLVAKNKTGSFYSDGESVLQELIDEADFSKEAGVLDFAREIIAHLSSNMKKTKPTPNSVESQLKESVTLQQLYDLVFGMEYLKPSYSLRWRGKSLDQLSPGEKGALLLVFYLLIDQSNVPLILDQPEENLDNETVAKTLVDCINEARARRQVIMVTHNPNLAVVCDADQVIRAHIDTENECEVSYPSGGIENPKMNKAIVDVLEGTRPAFDKRDSKYRAVSGGAV